MINRLQLLRNVGQFETVATAANLSLTRLALIYAENGRGKTTLAAILRSLGTSDPVPIRERRRLATPNQPHIVIECTGADGPAVFQNDTWSRSLPGIIIFDDAFVDQNVYSGLAVDPEHRQNLHELILGAKGIALNQTLHGHIARIEQHSRDLRAFGDALPVESRAGMTLDDFCALTARPEIDTDIQAAERALAAAEEQAAIAAGQQFTALSLPRIEVAEINALLERDLEDLDMGAVEQVQNHIGQLGDGGEAWIDDGMRRIPNSAAEETLPCPFCTQDISSIPIIEHYRAYFSERYTALKDAVSNASTNFERLHGGDAVGGLEREIRGFGERRQFWMRFCEVPGLTADTAQIARDRRAAKDSVAAAFLAKQRAPLERLRLSAADMRAIDVFNAHADAMAIFNGTLQEANTRIALVKERAATSNRLMLVADLARLRATKVRQEPAIVQQCTAYLAEKAAKATTEALRDQARQALDQYRQNVFPAYQAAINVYLARFNAGFRLHAVNSTNTRTGSSCTYSVLINNQAVAIGAANLAPGDPSFRSTLSAGDRNTLALAFFFTALDQDQTIAQKVVVIDDPITSLDDHRSLTTVQEIKNLAQRTAQVIVLSHSKPFLCRLWDGSPLPIRSALEVVRDATGSTIRAWDVTQDCITEHDRRHEMLRNYVQANVQNNRPIAAAIRPTLEAFCRVAYPEFFPPGTLLAPFRNVCQQRIGTPTEIMCQADITELEILTDYGNRFHHDSNPAFEVEQINDGELLDFVRRTLAFTKR